MAPLWHHYGTIVPQDKKWNGMYTVALSWLWLAVWGCEWMWQCILKRLKNTSKLCFGASIFGQANGDVLRRLHAAEEKKKARFLVIWCKSLAALPIQPPVRKQWPKMTLKVPLRSVVRSRPDVQDTMEMHIVSYCPPNPCAALRLPESHVHSWHLGIWLFNAVHVLCMPYESLWIPMTFWSFYVLKCCEANSAVCSVSISLCRRLAAPWRQKRFWRCHLLGRWIGMNQELGRSGQNPGVAPWVISYISQT